MTHSEAVAALETVVAPGAEVRPLFEAVRALAGLLDEDDSDPALWREYRFLLRDLRVALDSGGVTDGLDEEFAELDG